ncbi:MAG: roadblock/LC7 domain-containing protein, partial [Planctomycetota bacterium]
SISKSAPAAQSSTSKSASDPPSAVRPFSGSASGVKPALPAGHGSSGSRPLPTTAAGSGIRRSAIDTLAGEPGVKGAVVVDPQGQVVMMRGLSGGKDESVAAFAATVNAAIADVAKIAGHPAPSSWVLGAEQGQILAFRRDNGFAVVALAEASVRPAMLELRARQALIDLGAT